MRIGFTHYGYRLQKGQQYEEKKKEKTEGIEFAQIYREKIEEGREDETAEKANFGAEKTAQKEGIK